MSELRKYRKMVKFQDNATMVGEFSVANTISNTIFPVHGISIRAKNNPLILYTLCLLYSNKNLLFSLRLIFPPCDRNKRASDK